MSEQPNQNASQISFEVKVTKTDYSVVPGNRISIPLGLVNAGEAEDHFEISVRGIPLDWVSIANPVVRLSPGEELESIVEVEAPEASQVRAGQHKLKVVVRSQSNPTLQKELELVLTVAAFEVQGRIGVLMEAVQFSVAPGSSAVVPVVLLNQGLVVDNFKLSIEGLPVSWVSTSSPVTRLEPGEQKEVILTILPPRDAQSKAGRHTFKLTVTSHIENRIIVSA